ncbi:MAG: transposase [Lewinellaceae bacterium]|nr:transposase [Lewinellaceae bacterium]
MPTTRGSSRFRRDNRARANRQAYAHVASASKHTFFYLGKRDYATMDEMGILPEFKGIAIHDRYANYFGYNCEHGLCNAHLLRDLEAVIEQNNDYWACELQQLLKNINKAVKRAEITRKTAFSASHCAQYRQRYMNWVKVGLKLHPAVEKLPGSKKYRPNKAKPTTSLPPFGIMPMRYSALCMTLECPLTTTG